MTFYKFLYPLNIFILFFIYFYNFFITFITDSNIKVAKNINNIYFNIYNITCRFLTNEKPVFI